MLIRQFTFAEVVVLLAGGGSNMCVRSCENACVCGYVCPLDIFCHLFSSKGNCVPPFQGLDPSMEHQLSL